ncbi:MAG: DUF3644 domain-containing protein [Nitrospinae bacterium]|nr:DUF3644 domain-containing protein [Nitrospinota bacterium]
MKTPRYKAFVDKSVSAALSAIEIYNKPDFKYREETFAILMTNSWELLLKAKIIKENKNNLKSIYEMTQKVGKKGNQLKTSIPKLNRSGNPMTIGLHRCLGLCEQPSIKMSKVCIDNIFLLMEVRDNAIHFKNYDLHLSKKVFEIGTATLKNYLTLIKEWFTYDLSKYNFYLMPISFFHEFETAQSFSINPDKKQIENLLRYIAQKENENPFDETKTFNISLQLETRFVKSSSTDALLVNYSTDPSAIRINLQEEDILKRYPIGYYDLTQKLKGRYSDFKVNGKYHKIRRSLEQNQKFCRVRVLDPKNPKSPKKSFFNTEIFKEFDKHYTKQ